MRSRNLPWVVALGIATVQLLAAAEPGSSSPSPVAVGRAYLRAMETGDLDAAERLFAKRSLLFESGGVEGTWRRYREHHIGPELAETESFTTSPGVPEEEFSTDGTMAMLAWPVDYRIVLKDGRIVDNHGTLTFVMVREGDTYRIRHLHWSSRKKKA
jgi:hypothetical protein